MSGATAARAGKPVRVEVRAGLLAELPRRLPPAPGLFVLTDAAVRPLLPAAYAGVPAHVLPPGEQSKSWDELGRLLLALDAAGVDRDGHLLALGGGVVSDLGGLAASLHRRGIAWTAVPTSLVGQVDAALGGKTAVNLGGGKNTVGTFHEPVAVLVDPRALASLPARHLRAGMAEVLKTAVIAGGALYEDVLAADLADFAAGRPRAVDVIEACLATKLALVAEDLTDRGPRRLLNLGHTFGHAFEALQLPALLHGEAVGLGLLCAARLASAGDQDEQPAGLESVLRARLTAFGLPTTIALDPDAVLAEMRRDKKRRDGALVFVLPRAPGRVEIVAGVDPAAVRAALAAVGC